MNIQSRLPTTADEFLRWNEGREGKREFVGGRVVEMMIHTTRNHARLASNLVFALRQCLDAEEFDVGAADFGVRTPEGVRYPDVYVDRPGDSARGSDLAAIEPVLLAEILSPPSYGRDFVEKLAEYSGIPSLRHYLILSQEEPRLWLWSREAGDVDWPERREISGEDELLPLPAFGCDLPLSELYLGLRR